MYTIIADYNQLHTKVADVLNGSDLVKKYIKPALAYPPIEYYGYKLLIVPIPIKYSPHGRYISLNLCSFLLDNGVYYRLQIIDRDAVAATDPNNCRPTSLNLACKLLDSITSADPNILRDYHSSDLVLRDLYTQCAVLVGSLGGKYTRPDK